MMMTGGMNMMDYNFITQMAPFMAGLPPPSAQGSDYFDNFGDFLPVPIQVNKPI